MSIYFPVDVNFYDSPDISPMGSSPLKSSAILAAPCDKLRHSSRTMCGQNPNKMEPKCISFVTGLNTICPEKR